MRVLIGTATTKVVRELINNGKIRQARKRADTRVSNDAWFLIEDANFFYWYGRAVKLTDHNEKLLAKIKICMQRCPNNNSGLESDWLIDDAKRAIQQYDPDKAEKILAEVSLVLIRLDSDNTYRSALIKTLRGRIAYLRGDFKKALSFYLHTEWMWLNKSYDKAAYELWEPENLFYMLKAMVANRTRKAERRRIALEIIGGSYIEDKLCSYKIEVCPGNKSFSRRLRARLINSGRLGNTIDDLLSMIATLA